MPHARTGRGNGRIMNKFELLLRIPCLGIKTRFRSRAITAMIIAAVSGHAQATGPDAGKGTVDPDGAVHLPAMTVPFSQLASPEARRNFLDFVHAYDFFWDLSNKGDTIEACRKDVIEACRKELDD